MEMEKPYKKRAREDDDLEDRQESSKKNDAGKKQDLKGSDFNENNCEGSNVKALDSSLALDIGVFDFPWLKDGMISNSDDWRFEDAFSSSLYDKSTTSALEFPGQCLSESREALLDFSEDKLDDTLSQPVPKGNGLETEGVDKSIWSSLLTQPLQHGGTI